MVIQQANVSRSKVGVSAVSTFIQLFDLCELTHVCGPEGGSVILCVRAWAWLSDHIHLSCHFQAVKALKNNSNDIVNAIMVSPGCRVCQDMVLSVCVLL